MFVTAEQAAAEEAKAFDTTLNQLEREADRWDHLISQYTKRGYTEKLEHAKAEYSVVSGAVRAMRAYYQIKRWTRYYQVPDGKVHSSMGCQSCNHFYVSTGFSSTQFIWLTDFSGQPVAEMIKQFGTTMCTICFPDAPLDPAYQAAVKKTAAEKEEARSAKAAARDAKLAATPKGDDGKPLKVGSYGDQPKTERGARNLLAHYLGDVHQYRLISVNGTTGHPDEARWLEDAKTVARSIARMTGQDAETVYQEAYAKAEKKAAADLRKWKRDNPNG